MGALKSGNIIPKNKKATPQNFQGYIDAVKEDDLNKALSGQMPAAEVFFQSISEELSTRRYAEGKWTIKELLQHIIDAERVFAYRALCFARKEQSILPSFSENDYASNSNANDRKWAEIISEFSSVRKSTEDLFNSFNIEALQSVGKASNYSMDVTTLGFVIVGHVNHHIRIIQERYIGV